MSAGGAVSRLAARPALAGLCASLVGIGLARFAYTPLMPVLVEAGWFDAPAAAYLGAANLAGYLAGALGGAWIVGRLGAGHATRAMMLLAVATFVACAWPAPFAWFFAWRFLSGLAGGAVMVSAASLVMTRTPAAKRGRAGGLMFTGVGIGIAFSGAALPALIAAGLPATWLALGGASLLLTALAWPAGGVRAAPESESEGAPAASSAADPASARQVRAVTALYGLCAFGLAPHMVFLVDYVARDLGRGVGEGALIWTLFGLGALAGPMLAGRLADRIGFAAALRLAALLEVVAVGLPLVSAAHWALWPSAVVAGMLVPGLVPLALGRVRQLAPADERAKAAAWGRATAGFALGQAVAAYLLAYLYDETGRYALLFAVALAGPVLGLAIDVAIARLARNGLAPPGPIR